MLAVLAVGSGLIYFWNASNYETGPYQGGVARSMSLSFSNWLFGAVDPAGTVSLDKIPGSYWVTAIFVKLVGFHTASLVIPNALATIAAVIVMALAGRRIAKFATSNDAVADAVAFATGLVIIATPIISAVARSNEPESFFLLTMALAFHRAVIALQTASRKQLIYAGLFVALAFQTYMIEAWVIWPAIIVAWFTVSGRSKVQKLVDLLIAGSISLFASLLWILAVTITPPTARPYVGGTLKNSAFEMVFGYNALGRLSATGDAKLYRSFTPKFAGQAGILRLFNPQDAGQVGWLLLAAAVAVALLFLVQEFDSVLVLIGFSLATFFLEYSFVAGMHQYYTSVLAIPVAAALAYLLANGRGWMYTLVGLVAVASAFQISAIYPGYNSWVPFMSTALIGALVLVHGLASKSKAWLALILGLAVTATPLAWSIDTMNRPNSTNPVAGPPLRTTGHPGVRHTKLNPPRSGKSDLTAAREIKRYVMAHGAIHARYPVGVFGGEVATIITNASKMEVMPIGGFSGFDPVPTLHKFKQLTASGDLPYVIMGPRFVNRGIAGNTEQLSRYILANCKVEQQTLFGPLYRCAK